MNFIMRGNKALLAIGVAAVARVVQKFKELRFKLGKERRQRRPNPTSLPGGAHRRPAHPLACLLFLTKGLSSPFSLFALDFPLCAAGAR